MHDSASRQVQRELFLRSFFDTAPPPELADLLAERMKDRVYEPGDVLYERGQPSGSIFFVIEGTVELVAPGQEPWVFRDRSFLGGIDANMEEPHSRSARAATWTRAIEINFDEYLSLLEDFFDFAKGMLIQGARRTFSTALGLAPDGVFKAPEGPLGRWIGTARLDQVQRILILRRSHPFSRAPVQALVTLGRSASEERFRPGAPLVRAGQPNPGMYLIADGIVSIEGQNPRIVGRTGPGEFVFGVSAFDPTANSLSASAETEVVTLRISQEDLFDAMEEHFGLARSWWVYMGRENHRVRVELGRREAEEVLLSA